MKDFPTHLLSISSLLLFALPTLAQQPVASIRPPGGDTIYWYASESWTSHPPLRIRLTAAPSNATIDLPGARVEPIDPLNGEYLATYDRIRPGLTPLCLIVRTRGRVAQSCATVECHIPRMIDGIDNWKALEATVGELYNPSSFWLSTSFPPSHLYTTVEIDGEKRFESPGTIFQASQLPDALIVTDEIRSVVTRVYWRPAGTPVRAEWKLLATTDDTEDPAVPLETRRFRIDRK